MKKLLLVNTNIEKSPYPIPPLGICLIASFLKDHYDVRIYDGMFDEGRDLEQVIRSQKPEFIGFSIRNVDEMVPEKSRFYVEEAYLKFIEPARKLSNAPFILGGSGYTIFPQEILDYTGADYGIAGEGEEPLMALLQALERGEDARGIPGVYVRSGEGTAMTDIYSLSGKRRTIRCIERDFNSRPFSETDRKLDFSLYTGRGVYSIQTKRGCALHCLYCSYPLLEGSRYRLRSPVSIVDEIEEASERVGKNVTFEFVDSTFNEPKGHAEDICRELIRRKLNVRLRTMGVNPRNTSKELFGLMLDAGFAQIDVTPDSASPSVIKNLRKGFTMDDIRRTARLIKEFDLPAMWFFLFGGPGENQTTFSETIDFIDKYINPADMVYMSGGLRIYPGTPLYKLALMEGCISLEDNLLYPFVFYFSPESPRPQLREWILEACSKRHHCLPSSDTTPPPEMLREAVALRNQQGLREPMFRTLLRLRKEWKAKGKLS
ncbi:MAG: radical SAM protein [Bacteroidetes bacterium]|nr:radical SAM protein [Bacteroidota bacterium]